MNSDHAERRVLAGKIAGSTNLFDIRLTKSVSELHSIPTADAKLDVDLKISPSAQTSATEDGARLLLVNADFAVTINAADSDAADDANPALAAISCSLTAAFQNCLEDEPTQDELDAFADTTGIFALYPYAREFFSDATRRMGLPVLVLDLLRR